MTGRRRTSGPFHVLRRLSDSHDDVATLPNGAPYMVMEYLEGQALNKVISEAVSGLDKDSWIVARPATRSRLLLWAPVAPEQQPGRSRIGRRRDWSFVNTRASLMSPWPLNRHQTIFIRPRLVARPAQLRQSGERKLRVVPLLGRLIA